MFTRLVISLVLIGKLKCVTSDSNTTGAQCSPTTDGTKRFGTGCKYACHCINNEQFNYTTGECGSGCDFEWVGPSCQYKNIAHAELSRQIDNIYPAEYSYLANDNNSSTCSFTDSAVPEERLATRTVAPWWSLWLPYDATFRKLLFVTRRNYSCKTSYFPFFKVTVHNISLSDFTNFVYRTNGVSCYQHDDYIPQDATFKVNCTGAPVGNQIRLQLANMSTQLVLCDFRVYGECKDRTWGIACNECGFCKDFSQCDATNGSCLSGCEPGYIPPLCSKANTNQTGCDCTDGYYCENTYEYPTICPTGHFCVNGLKSPCSAGTFTNNSGSAQCEQCTPGYYCPNLGLSTVTDVCWIGHYCPEGAVVPSPCPNGYYQTDTGKSDCIICPVNFYCNQTEAEAEKQSGTSKPTHGVVTPKECQPKRCLKPGLSGELDPFEIGGLSISISCKPSCRQHMTPFTDLKFMANCDGCENEVSSYQWSIRECFSEVIQECEHYVNSVTFLTESTGYYTAIPHNDKQNWTYIAVVVKGYSSSDM
ncbi:uncharacterized protein LOC128546696 [Mercenaria mercenaria]|uniref:uncharacterized protein LOC128546696 n=1 Tax=Mercenaria mercenaria TaxID=6596 RepID=UPI00234F8809|nr:uncharacterized protein LOC128546696 [Mercenaria mercenaria]